MNWKFVIRILSLQRWSWCKPRRGVYLLVVTLICLYMVVSRLPSVGSSSREDGSPYIHSLQEALFNPSGYERRKLRGTPLGPHFSSDQLIGSHRSHKSLDDCIDTGPPQTKLKMRGTEYWVLYNYIKASLTFKCNESVTITTHTEIPYLHNLEPLLDRWRGPVSVAIFTPGSDYKAAVEAVHYYRQCTTNGTDESLVSRYATFHFYFPVKHLPSSSFMSDDLSSDNYQADCDKAPPNVDDKVEEKSFASYRSRHKLTYPINVGRNVAREAVTTHFVFASDIELYPSPGLISKFLEMVRSSNNQHSRAVSSNPNPRVYVNTIFEIKDGLTLPTNKTELVEYLERGDVIPFHKYVCSSCHLVPKYEEWKTLPVHDGLDISVIAKRRAPWISGQAWEPIYIGTNQDPLYDERLHWEGKADKMSQAYVMCVLDYDFMVLDNAFLIHRPGIKTRSSSNGRLERQQRKIIQRSVVPELKRLYGIREGCHNYV